MKTRSRLPRRFRHRGWRAAVASAVFWTGIVLLTLAALVWAVAWRVAIVAGGVWLAWRLWGAFQ